MRCLVEPFIVIDAEGKSTASDRSAGTGDLRREEAGSNRRHHDERRKVVEVGNIGANCEAWDLRVVPIDWKGNRRVAEHAEVKRVVSVLPDVVATDNEVLAKCLLQSGVKFVLEPRLKVSRRIRAGKKRIEHGAQAALTRQHEVFVEGRFQRSRIRETKNGICWLDAVRNSKPRLRLTGDCETVV